MRRSLYIIIALIGFTALGQSRYETGMRKAFSLWQDNKQWEAANLFERISQAEPDNWLPAFYVAQINVLYSFDEKDKEKMVAQMQKAKEFLDYSKGISENNPELLVLEAQLMTAWIVYDSQQYGMKNSPKVAQLYQKAYEIAPENPRVVMGKANWDIGSAKFFGQPTDVFCDDIRKAISLFESEEPKSEFEPRGGGEYAQQVLEQNCGK